MKQLTTLIEQDPVLTTKIFKLTNSASFAIHREIESLSQTIAWLGLNSVAGLAFALAVQDGVFLDRGYEREVRTLWAHAIATAFYAKTLAGMIGKNKDTAFLCGLLHSVGKIFVVHTVNLCRPPTVEPLSWTAMDLLMEQSYVEVGNNWGMRGIFRPWSKKPSVFINIIPIIWPPIRPMGRPHVSGQTFSYAPFGFFVDVGGHPASPPCHRGSPYPS